ncbi:hypothetical protein OAE88_00615 [bacterium]|nr:hypothetical protein [bacterium]
MTKQEELDIIDGNIRRLLIEATKVGGDTSILPELNTAIQYVSKNNVVSEKAKSSVEEDIQKRLDEANERRANGNT